MQIDLIPFLSQGADFELAAKIINQLNHAGFKAYFAGGCVRDALLGRKFKDIDIATDALPDQIEELFKGRTIPVGKKFGIIIVHQGAIQIEVATFRKDGDYQDGRRPEEVQFSNEKEDALRRDFTANALFYDLNKKQVLDYVGGVQDIQNKILRTVGDSKTRFSEDYLRIHRLFRFSLSLHFSIESETLKSAKDQIAGIGKVSAERKHEELLKVFFSGANKIEIYQFYFKEQLFKLFFDQELKEVPANLFQSEIGDEIDLLSILLWNEANAANLLLNKLKLSSKTQKSVLRILKYRKDWQEVVNSSEPDKCFHCLQAEFVRFLKKQKALQSAPEIDRLLSLAVKYDAHPPEALLNGDDLKTYFQGKDLGRALELVFKEQLVQDWSQKEQALAWILKQKV